MAEGFINLRIRRLIDQDETFIIVVDNYEEGGTLCCPLIPQSSTVKTA